MKPEIRSAKILSTAALAFAAAALVAGCGNNIGPDANKADLKGDVTAEQVFAGGPQSYHTRLSAKFLKAGGTYTAKGRLTIDGDIPPGTAIQVENGKLSVNGNVGEGSKLEVSIPVSTHIETRKYSGWCYGYDFGSGKFEYSYKMTPRCTEHKTIIDGATYNDPEPAIEIKGDVGKNVNLASKGTITAAGKIIQSGLAPVSR